MALWLARLWVWLLVIALRVEALPCGNGSFWVGSLVVLSVLFAVLFSVLFAVLFAVRLWVGSLVVRFGLVRLWFFRFCLRWGFTVLQKESPHFKEGRKSMMTLRQFAIGSASSGISCMSPIVSLTMPFSQSGGLNKSLTC